MEAISTQRRYTYEEDIYMARIYIWNRHKEDIYIKGYIHKKTYIKKYIYGKKIYIDKIYI